MSKDTKLYKVLVDGVSCNGGDYKYSLPKKDKKGNWIPGKWTKRIAIKNLSMCNVGYHLTNNPTGWFQTDAKVYLAEAKDNVGWDGDKCLCAQVRLLEEIDTNTGKENTGAFNSGYRNTGAFNSGARNSGYRNSGARNSGYNNSGDKNTGDSNSGYNNSGDSNSGAFNSGYRNSGYRNSGARNSGNWNEGHYHTGCFNTGKPKKIYLFEKLMSYERYQKIDFPSYFYFELTVWVPYTKDEMKDDKHKTATEGYLKTLEYKEAWKKSFKEASSEQIKKTVKLPHFDYKIFHKITGITKNMIQKRCG